MANSKLSAGRFAERARRIAFYSADTSEYAGRALDGVLRYVDDHGGLALRDFWDDLNAPGRYDAFLAGPPPWAAWEPDGIVAILPHGAGVPAWVGRHAGAPLVSLGAEFRDVLPAVYIDVDSIASLAVEHFDAVGYPHVGFVGIRGNVSVDLRLAAMERRLADAGRQCHTHALAVNPWPGLYDVEAAATADPGLAAFLRAAPRPIGLLATTDQAARVVATACERLGLRVPGEVGVLGVDNYLASRAARPALSSIHTPGDDVGRAATAMLVERLLAGEDDAASIAIPVTKLVQRGSTGDAGGPEAEVLRALSTLRARACEGVPVEQILKDLAVSRSTLQRQFAALVGHTPGQEMLRVRLERAKELLRGTDLSVARIAELTGYERPGSFSEFFQRQAGMSPRAFRGPTAVGRRATNG